MAVNLDQGQFNTVSGKRKKDRPKYYNAGSHKKQTISEDFEAYLILQGRDQNKRTIEWLREAGNYSIADSDRDSLLDQFMTAEENDALHGEVELLPLSRLFTRFKSQFLLTGFEGVSEVGQLLADLQRPMLETQAIINKHKHRQVYSNLCHGVLRANGVDTERKKQLDSWYVPLTFY
jgi:hypothetical protein